MKGILSRLAQYGNLIHIRPKAIHKIILQTLHILSKHQVLQVLLHQAFDPRRLPHSSCFTYSSKFQHLPYLPPT